MRRLATTSALVLLTLAWWVPQPASGRRATARVQPLARVAGTTPRNVVFILTDDHRYDALGFMGHPIVKTPNMDRIARRGTRSSRRPCARRAGPRS